MSAKTSLFLGKAKFIGSIICLLFSSAAFCEGRIVHSLSVHHDSLDTPTPVGFIYTSTNDSSDNKVIRLTRYSDGSVGNESVFSTAGKGAANPNSSGKTYGNFNSQGAIKIIGNYLLVVNAGNSTISVFQLNKSDGNLSLISEVPSGGLRPVSIASAESLANDDERWVLVANQESNPVIVGDDENPQMYPNKDYFSQDLTAPDPSDRQRNISVFKFNTKTGALTKQPEPLLTFNRDNGGPTSISLDYLRQTIAVSTNGIAQIIPDPQSSDLQLEHPSNIILKGFNKLTGGLSDWPNGSWKLSGISGISSINFSKHFGNVVYFPVSNLATSKQDHEAVSLYQNAYQLKVNSNIALNDGPNTPQGDGWSVLSPDGMTLYVSSFNRNSIETVHIDSTFGKFIDSDPVVNRGDYAPTGDSKDLYVTPDNKYIYNLGAFRSYSLSGFAIDSDDGKLSYLGQYTYQLTKDAVGKPGVYNFMGLTGFDIEKPQG
ncbi:beta-propeller fold lactonase family protein [Parashewanella tropica]|uniref:beta-propeller fold lactonase family protein n=1 Tax=Parashewanella tropica TaxID=2547970 RepID=UPI00147870F6|nr:beta-propeller fold lactonase family protein [Parashewanella tropica]